MKSGLGEETVRNANCFCDGPEKMWLLEPQTDHMARTRVVLPWQREAIVFGPMTVRELKLTPLYYLGESYFPRQSWFMTSF